MSASQVSRYVYILSLLILWQTTRSSDTSGQDQQKWRMQPEDKLNSLTQLQMTCSEDECSVDTYHPVIPNFFLQ